MAARRIFVVGILAGLIAGFAATAFQSLKLLPLIAAAELYEQAAAHPAAATLQPGAHQHAAPVATDAAAAEWEPAAGAQRWLFTALANALVGVGFGLLLSAGLALRGSFAGIAPDARQGLLWGVAGFIAFQLAPAIGLPPELPGSIAADLAARQIWWAGTAIATAAGLALVALPARRGWKTLAGAAFILAPHLVGAPAAEHLGGSAPPELAAEFVVASLVSAAFFWLVLGGAGGWLYQRLGHG